MTNMIKADIYRSMKHSAVYVAVGLMLLMLVVSIYMVSPGRISIVATSGGAVLEDTGMTLEEFSRMSIGELREFMKSQDGYKLDRDILAVNSNLYYVFIFIAAVVIAVDFTGGCAKNTLSSAISREKYFFSKVLTVILLCLLLYFGHTYLMYFANVIFNGRDLASGLWEITEIILVQLPAVLMIIVIPTGIAFMVKKTAMYNVITIPFLMILRLLFGYGSALLPIPEKAMNYIPDVMLMMLANNPDKEYLTVSYLVCAVVCVLFLTAGYLIFKKSEIK